MRTAGIKNTPADLTNEYGSNWMQAITSPDPLVSSPPVDEEYEHINTHQWAAETAYAPFNQQLTHGARTRSYTHTFYFSGASDISAGDFATQYIDIVTHTMTRLTNTSDGAELEWIAIANHEQKWMGTVYFNKGKKAFGFQFIGAIPLHILNFVKELKSFFPPVEPDKSGRCTFSFWSLGTNGPRSFNRLLTVPTWDEVRDNYPGGTHAALSELRMMEPPFLGGRLILLHGEPGTGKSHIIRTLADSWREWCKYHYIVDPERFFGNADYMTSVILDDDDDDDSDDWDTPAGPPAVETDENCIKKEPWKLIIVEDADEFLVADAKERSGQALSRLLNISDGLIGQGLRSLILITTNEKVENLHPAVAREGRCTANIGFETFDRAGAKKWLANHQVDVDIPNKQSYTLAELYGYYGKIKQIKNAPLSNVSTGVYV